MSALDVRHPIRKDSHISFASRMRALETERMRTHTKNVKIDPQTPGSV